MALQKVLVLPKVLNILYVEERIEFAFLYHILDINRVGFVDAVGHELDPIDKLLLLDFMVEAGDEHLFEHLMQDVGYLEHLVVEDADRLLLFVVKFSEFVLKA